MSSCDIRMGSVPYAVASTARRRQTRISGGSNISTTVTVNNATSLAVNAAIGQIAAIREEEGPAAVYRELYEQRSLAALRLWARAVANTTSVSDGRALVSLLTLADYQAAGAGEDETEAIVDMLRSVGGVEVAVLVKEQTSGSRVRVSLRSQGWDVSALAAERGGGGHQRAAGFSADDDPQEVVAWLSSVLGARLQTASS